MELPIGIVCCCVPSLRPVMVEVAPLFNSLASRLLTYGRSRGGSSAKSYPSQSKTGHPSATDSSAGFAQLHHGRDSLGNKTSAQADDIELVTANGNTYNDSPQAIHVVNAYSVGRQ